MAGRCVSLTGSLSWNSLVIRHGGLRGVAAGYVFLMSLLSRISLIVRL